MIIKKKTAHSFLLMYDVLEQVWPVAMLSSIPGSAQSASRLRTHAAVWAVFFFWSREVAYCDLTAQNS